MSKSYHYFNKPYERPQPRNYIKEASVEFVRGTATMLASALAVAVSLTAFTAFLVLVVAP